MTSPQQGPDTSYLQDWVPVHNQNSNAYNHEQTDSESETDIGDINYAYTPAKTSRPALEDDPMFFPQWDGPIDTRPIKTEQTPFVPPKDIPKRGLSAGPSSARWNSIRSMIKVEDSQTTDTGPVSEAGSTVQSSRLGKRKLSNMHITSLADTDDDPQSPRHKSNVSVNSQKSSRVCIPCKAKKQRCTHKVGTGSAAASTTNASDTAENRLDVKPFLTRKKNGTLYTRIPHDRSKGLSMSRSAVDYRERNEGQQQYLARLAEMLDDDIVDQVEAEGGITPLGRLFKASVRMMERVNEQRASGSISVPKAEREADVTEEGSVFADSRKLREEKNRLHTKVNDLQRALRSFLDE